MDELKKTRQIRPKNERIDDDKEEDGESSGCQSESVSDKQEQDEYGPKVDELTKRSMVLGTAAV